MVATIEIDESNGVGEDLTDDISNCNFGDDDSANLTPATYPIVAGENSYEKYWKLDFAGTFNQIDNLKIWKSAGNYVTDEGIDTNARESSYGGAESYVQPIKTTSTKATQVFPVTEPSGTNLGFGGSLGGNITSAGKSDYLIMQSQTSTSTPAGDVTQKTFTFQYDEQ